MLSRSQFNADVLCGVSVVLANLREDDGAHQIALKARAHGFLVLRYDARIQELIQLQTLADLLAQGIATSFPLLLIII